MCYITVRRKKAVVERPQESREAVRLKAELEVKSWFVARVKTIVDAWYRKVGGQVVKSHSSNWVAFFIGGAY